MNHADIRYRFEKILLISPSSARFGQQQCFFTENQHDIPSPCLLSEIFMQPSGHRLPTKQNGAMPYHLHSASTGCGTIAAASRKMRTMLVMDEAITLVE